jgi:ankyrin repeat protein
MKQFQSLLLILASLTGLTSAVLETEDFLEFLENCADGKTAEVVAGLKANADWAKEASPEGETCLHVAGIHGEVEVTKALMAAGVDPNLMSHMLDDPDEDPIQMHALSWHVFGGHLESAKLLLDHGADPNALMDSITEEKERVTVLDMLEQLLAEEDDASAEEIAPFQKMMEMLKEHGAKRREEL